MTDVMAFLESMAPSVKKTTEEVGDRKSHKKSRNRSRSPTSDDDRSSRRRRSTSRDRNDDDRRRRRSRSRDRQSSRRVDRSRSRDRSRRQRSRSRSRDRKESRRPDNPRGSSHVERAPPNDPELGCVYNGKVANITGFGCFVALEGFRRKVEGLVHISQLRREGRVGQNIFFSQFFTRHICSIEFVPLRLDHLCFR